MVSANRYQSRCTNAGSLILKRRPHTTDPVQLMRHVKATELGDGVKLSRRGAAAISISGKVRSARMALDAAERPLGRSTSGASATAPDGCHRRHHIISEVPLSRASCGSFTKPSLLIEL